MLEVHHLKKNYHSKSGVEVKALDDVSLKLPSKGMVFILGKSGSGKSTLLNVLGGLDGFDSGEFYVKGKQINSFRQSDFDSYRNTYVGFIFQEYNIIDDFTVGQNIALAMQLQGKKPNADDINSILKEVDLEGLGDRKPNELSGGQKQRVAIARALIKKPQIIMADEPTGALDSNTGIQIFDTLKKLSKDKLVLIVSHDREFSERYADRIIEIKDGSIISDVENTAKGKDVKEENITCAGDTIIVREDYVLKQSDLKVINDYLKHCKNGGKIKTGTGLKTKSTFKNTNQDNIKMDNSGFALIKSKLPLNYAFKMGMKGLGHKKFKLVLTIFLSVISFGMLGMSTSMMFFDNKSATVDTFVNSNINFASVSKIATTGDYYSSYPLKFDQAEFNKAKEAIGTEGQYVISQSYNGGYGVDFNRNINSYDYNTAFKTNFNGVSAINSAKDLLDKFDFYSQKSTTANLGNNDIIISSYIATSILEKGYCECTGGEPIYYPEVNSFENLINQTLYLNLNGYYEEYKIVDIVDTNFNFSDAKYKNIIENNQMYGDQYGNEFRSYIDASLASTLFVNQTTANAYQTYITGEDRAPGIGSFGVFALPDNRAGINKMVNFTFEKHELTQEEKDLYPEAKINASQYMLTDQLSASVNSMATSLSSMKQIFLYIGLAFIVFSGLLLANFIANSINYQKKEIGILRAIGSRSKDVFKIYYSESIVIALINFVIASIGAWAIMNFAIVPSFTKMLSGVTLFSFGIIPVLIILGVALFSSFLATFIPVYHTARKKPVEAIRNK